MLCLPSQGLAQLALAYLGVSAPVCAAPASAHAPEREVTLQCAALGPGLNEGFVVEGEARSFYLDLPTDVGERPDYPVVFTWHGLQQSALDVRPFMAAHVDDPGRPFVAVTPEDTDVLLKTPVGELNVDWDVFDAEEGSKEVALFDAVLDCVDQRWGVDEDRVHSVGVSLGGVVTNYLGAARGEQLASVVSFSGAYWSNPAHDDPILDLWVDWPEPQTGGQYAQLMAHGGDADRATIYGTLNVDFQKWARQDAAFLHDKGHRVVLCDHGEGHFVPEALRGAPVLEFLFDHPRGGQPSTWSEELPMSMPAYCEMVET